MNHRMSSDDARFDVDQIKRTVLRNGYIVSRHIGSGGNATCFLVRSVKYECDFVAKVTHLDGRSIERENEAEALKNLTHKNIVQLYELFRDDRYYYMIIEYCPGGSLEDLIAREGPIQRARLVSICTQVCEAVRACHEVNIAHRDIKPANILLDAYGRPKLADFGLSDVYDQPFVRSQAGSLAFMAPEIITGTGGHNPFKADVWALGVTFFYMGTGALPWQTQSVPDLLRAIKLGPVDWAVNVFDREFVALLKQMLCVDATRRIDVYGCLECPALTRPDMEHPHANPRTMLRRVKSRSLAGLKFVCQSQKKLGVVKEERLGMAEGASMKSSACLLSFAPSFVAESCLLPARKGAPKQATFV